MIFTIFSFLSNVLSSGIFSGSVSKQSEMDCEPNCRFCKKSFISGKRINTVPVFGVSRNKTLLVDSGQVAKTALYWRKRLNPQDFLLSKEKAFPI